MWLLSSIFVAALVPGGRNIPPMANASVAVESFYAGDQYDTDCRLQLRSNATFTYMIRNCYGAVCRTKGLYVKKGSRLILYPRCRRCCTARRLSRALPAVGKRTYTQRLCLLAARVRLLKSRMSRTAPYSPLYCNGVPRSLSRVVWGRRLYLISAGEKARFRKAIRLAKEPRSKSTGDFLLRVGDEKVRTKPGSVPIF